MPYASAAQRRFMHAVHPKIAAKWDDEIKRGTTRSAPTRPGVKVKVQRGQTVTMDGVEKSSEVAKNRAMTARLARKAATKPRRAARTVDPLPDNAKDMTPDQIRARLKRNAEIINPEQAARYRGRKPNQEPRPVIEGPGIDVKPQQARIGATIAGGSAVVGTPALIHHHQTNKNKVAKVGTNVRDYPHLPENIRSLTRSRAWARNPISPLDMYAGSRSMARFMSGGSVGRRIRKPYRRDVGQVQAFNMGRQMLFSPLGRGSVQGM